MAGDLPSISYMALYIVSASVVTDSRSATHWRLDQERGLVRPAGESDLTDLLAGEGETTDPLLGILTRNTQNPWEDSNPGAIDGACSTCGKLGSGRNSGQERLLKLESETTILTCGEAVNETQYDHLDGIAQRHKHKSHPEPEVAMIFKKTEGDEIDMNALEQNLRMTLDENPKSIAVYNQIGNFFRIRGNTFSAIECFRKALSLSPSNPDILLNLARVLFNLQYLDDAIHLTRRSLELQPPGQNCWLHHFTLGEILKAYGNYHEASIHFRHALDLNPSFLPARAHLQSLANPQTSSATVYTAVIISCLIVGVLICLWHSLDICHHTCGSPARKTLRTVDWDRSRISIPSRVIRFKKV
ncbi:hypothetical protein Bbelb_220270 [Branchiostoma belcheri]|nr:hypothetical protein Bbelb_220270 [Branchiostoma belcheri]